MNKRGASHIEVILSFVLFIGVVGFALYFFSPVNNSTLVDSSLYYAFKEFFNNVSVGVETYSTKINTSQSINIIAVNISPAISANNNVRVETYDGNVLPSRRQGEIVYLDRQGSNFTKIKFSQDFTPYQGFAGSAPLDSNNYTIASSTIEDIISEKRVVSLNSSYNLDYTEVKKNFDLPNTIDFSFDLRFSQNDFISPNEIRPENVEIFSENRKEQILRNNGGIGFADLRVTIW